VAAVAAARPSARDAEFAAKGEAASPAMAGFDVDVDFVNEHQKKLVSWRVGELVNGFTNLPIYPFTNFAIRIPRPAGC
jgi:hypothetical protein